MVTPEYFFAYTNRTAIKLITEGFGVAAAYLQNRQIAFKTDHDNKLLFFQADSCCKKTVAALSGLLLLPTQSYTIRKGFFLRNKPSHFLILI